MRIHADPDPQPYQEGSWPDLPVGQQHVSVLLISVVDPDPAKNFSLNSGLCVLWDCSMK